MRLARFGNDRLGIVEGECVRDVSGALDVLPHYRYPLPAEDPLVAHLDAVVGRAAALGRHAESLPLSGVVLRSPVANPGKVIAAPVNYQKHLDEVRGSAELHHENAIHAIARAGLFLKAPSSIVGPGEGVALVALDRRTDHEVELAVVIGRRVRNVRRTDALACVAGYCIGLDITLRGPEERSFRKSIDSYTVLGPWLVTAGEIRSPDALALRLSVNGVERQRSNTRHLILGVAELIEFASSFYTLHPGDVVLTGTPEGVGPIRPGDTIEAAIDRIGTMRVDVRAA